ncbi:MAG: N-acetylglucosamine-6-phosphate deacetylase [Acidobacteria bacterium]|nr:N-acetylglucosamine-6-phosphate deacetylase [Acidobacteriota bacterium]
MTTRLIHNAKIMLKDAVQYGGVVIGNGRIVQVFVEADKPTGFAAHDTLDLHQNFLAPGMIDIHIHGSAGVDVQNATQEDLAKLAEFLLHEGVTGYLATFVPTAEQNYQQAIAEIETYIAHQEESQHLGARILGIHFEGPFVSHEKCGALQRQHFRTYDGNPRSLEIFTQRKNLNLPYARTMTLAPEIAGGLALIAELTRHNVRSFIGHTIATPEILDQAVSAGAHHITHFPNALEALHHRQPGAVAWGLLNPEVTLDCIADFHHVHPLMLRLMYRNKTAERMALISDAILASGLGDGEFTVWGDRIAVKDGLTALVDGAAKGTIAGSVISMREALKNLAGLGIPLNEAVCMASLIPARAAGIAYEYGSIAVGKRADLMAFDEAFKVHWAMVNGAIRRY